MGIRCTSMSSNHKMTAWVRSGLQETSDTKNRSQTRRVPSSCTAQDACSPAALQQSANAPHQPNARTHVRGVPNSGVGKLGWPRTSESIHASFIIPYEEHNSSPICIQHAWQHCNADFSHSVLLARQLLCSCQLRPATRSEIQKPHASLIT